MINTILISKLPLLRIVKMYLYNVFSLILLMTLLLSLFIFYIIAFVIWGYYSFCSLLLNCGKIEKRFVADKQNELLISLLPWTKQNQNSKPKKQKIIEPKPLQIITSILFFLIVITYVKKNQNQVLQKRFYFKWVFNYFFLNHSFLWLYSLKILTV